MPTLTIVIGLPGAGKSTYCKRIAENGQTIYHDFIAGNLDLYSNRGICAVLKELKEGRDCLANEISLCLLKNREILTDFVFLMIPDVQIVWLAFERDVQRCKANVERDSINRTDFEKRLAAIDRYSVDYSYPNGAELLRTVQPEQDRAF